LICKSLQNNSSELRSTKPREDHRKTNKTWDSTQKMKKHGQNPAFKDFPVRGALTHCHYPRLLPAKNAGDFRQFGGSLSTSNLFHCAIEAVRGSKQQMAKKPEKPLSKTEILNSLAEATGQSRKDVGAVLDAMEALIEANISKGPGVFNLPGLLKIYVHVRPATKERVGRNPATGEEITIKARPASKVVKAKPLKKLKEMI
jgi:nucleoid DNA-binding protein